MAGTADREQDAAEESNYSTILHALCRLFRERYTAWDGNGRERLAIVWDGMGIVFKLIATRGNGMGMDLSQLDGMGLVMIVIPVSLSNPNVIAGIPQVLSPATGTLPRRGVNHQTICIVVRFLLEPR